MEPEDQKKGESSPPSHRRSRPSTRESVTETQKETNLAFIIYAKERKLSAAIVAEPPCISSPLTTDRQSSTTSSTCTCTEGFDRHISVEDSFNPPAATLSGPVGTSTPSRPCSLALQTDPEQQKKRRVRQRSPPPSQRHSTHKRVPSNCSDRGANTPVPDPPLFSPCVATSGAVVEKVEMGRRLSNSSPPSCDPLATAGAVALNPHEPLAGIANVIVPQNPTNAQKAMKIARVLRNIGDDLESEYGRECIEAPLMQIIGGENVREGANAILQVLQQLLTRGKLGETFSSVYHVLERLTESPQPGEDRLNLVQKLWEFVTCRVSNWVHKHGGWSSIIDSGTDGGVTCLPAGSPAPRQRRSRILSLSESGSFVDEDGDVVPQNGTPQASSWNLDDSELSSSDFEGSMEAISSLHGSGEFQPALYSASPPTTSGFYDSGFMSSVELAHASQTSMDDITPPSPLLTSSSITMTTCPGDHLTSVHSVPNLDSSSPLFNRNRSMSLPPQLRRRPPLTTIQRRGSERQQTSYRMSGLGVSASVLYAAIRALLNGD